MGHAGGPTSRGGAISYVAINVLSVPEGAGRTLEERLPSPSAVDDPAERLLGDEQVAVLAEAMASDLSEL